MSHSKERIAWKSAQPLRVRFKPTIDKEPVASIDDPVLYISSSPQVPLEERVELTTASGLEVDAPYVIATVPVEHREEAAWYRFDLRPGDGPQTHASGHIDKVDV